MHKTSQETSSSTFYFFFPQNSECGFRKWTGEQSPIYGISVDVERKILIKWSKSGRMKGGQGQEWKYSYFWTWIDSKKIHEYDTPLCSQLFSNAGLLKFTFTKNVKLTLGILADIFIMKNIKPPYSAVADIHTHILSLIEMFSFRRRESTSRGRRG